jgi:hypothetical protein
MPVQLLPEEFLMGVACRESIFSFRYVEGVIASEQDYQGTDCVFF